VNGGPAESWTVTGAAPSNLRISLGSISNFANEIDVEFTLPDAVMPATLGDSTDRRQLGLGLIDLVVE
jgi:thiamine biosynthesis protein ThiC